MVSAGPGSDPQGSWKSIPDIPSMPTSGRSAKDFSRSRGGHRIRITGKAVVESGHAKTVRDISSLNITSPTR